MSSSRSTSSSTLSIPQTAPAGGLTITKPPQTATSFFKIAPSQPITFAWNMTSVIATPTHLTISAICDNGNTYPVGPTDGIIPGTATQVVWDVYSYNQANPNKPLAQATYTLSIWDDRGPGSMNRGGYLQPNSAVHFALYTPEPYTPISSGQLPFLSRCRESNLILFTGWGCSVCSGAGTYAAHPAFISLLVTFFLIFFSGFHLIRSSSRAIQA